jgi:hypothetical protein
MVDTMRVHRRLVRRPLVRPMTLPVLGLFGLGPIVLIALVSVASCASIVARLAHHL